MRERARGKRVRSLIMEKKLKGGRKRAFVECKSKERKKVIKGETNFGNKKKSEN